MMGEGIPLKMTPARKRMLAVLADGTMHRDMILHRSGSFGSGLRVLIALHDAGLIEQPQGAAWRDGPKYRLTDAGRALLTAS